MARAGGDTGPSTVSNRAGTKTSTNQPEKGLPLLVSLVNLCAEPGSPGWVDAGEPGAGRLQAGLRQLLPAEATCIPGSFQGPHAPQGQQTVLAGCYSPAAPVPSA